MSRDITGELPTPSHNFSYETALEPVQLGLAFIKDRLDIHADHALQWQGDDL